MFSLYLQTLRRIFRDEGLLIFFVLVPLAYPLLYAFIYTNEVVRDVPAVAVDESCTPLSREFLHKVDATPDVAVAFRAANLGEARELLRRREAYGIIYLPADFSRRLHREEQAHVSLFCDMSGLLYYKSLVIACTDVSLAMNRDVQIDRLPAATPREEAVETAPFRVEQVALFNPQVGFASFLIPAVLMVIIQQTLLLGVGLAAGTDRERLRCLPAPTGAQPVEGSRPIVALLAPALACLTLYAVTSAYVLVAVPHFFRLIQLADGLSLLLFSVPYLLACTFFATAVARLVPNREAVMLLVVFTSIPLLFLSGISWPGASIPWGWKLFSWLFPSTFGINGYVRLCTMGGSLADVLQPFFALCVQAVAYFLLSLWRRGKKVG